MARYYFLLLFILILNYQDANCQKKRVLVLHSYHPELEWTDNVNKGIEKAFEASQDNVLFVYEYLDRKRNVGEEYYKKTEELFRIKINHQLFDLIIASDNDALNFAIKNREEFFNDIPIVFCGINNYRDSLIAGHQNITGVTEKPDFKATLNLIIKNHPNAKTLYIINDNKTTTALENKKLLQNLEEAYRTHLKFVFWEDISIPKMKENIQNLNPNDVVLLSTYNKDPDGNYISYKENRELIPLDIKNPVYTSWFFFMGKPILGGKIISGEEQGFMAGNMAIRILNGEKAKNIPIIKESLSRYTFSYPALQQHNISIDNLPKDSVILDKPRSFYTVHKNLILAVVIVFIISLIIILVLSNAIIRRRRAELSLLEKQASLEKSYRFQKLNAKIVSLLNSTNDFTLVTDKILQEITDNYQIGKVSLYNLDEEEHIDSVIGSNISKIGGGITELQEEDYHRLSRIINLMKKEGAFISSDLSNMTEEEKEFYKKREIGAIMLLAIKIGDRIFGMAGFAQKDHYNWQDEQVVEISTIVRLISNAWERNVQMNKHLQAEKRNVKATRMIEQSSRLASIGVMASGITHEINQPLNAIKVNLGAIKYWDKRNRGQMPSFIQGKLDSTLQGVNRIDEIIKHMRNFWIAPSESDKINEIDLNKAVTNAFSLVESQIAEHGIIAKTTLSDKEVKVNASFIQVEQIIINLVVNAIQALDKTTHKQKLINITVVDEDKQALLMVEDNATGIDEKIGNTLYDPFYSTKIKGEGTGLGMALVKTFVDKIQGSITYRNNDQGGVTFYITIKK